MKVLVYGAGVLGSVYAVKLQEAGVDVTILARGQRLKDINEHGIVLENSDTYERTITPVKTIEHLQPDDAYDLVLVIVRRNQLASVLPDLAANKVTPNVLFMHNNASGPQPLIDALGKERVLLGFVGAGGTREGYVVRYRLVPGDTQPTTIGELDGSQSARIQAIAEMFRAAGLAVTISDNMDAWLKTHVALISPIANAIYMAGGDNYRLARTRDAVVLMVRAVREGLRVLQAKGIPITPKPYRALLWLPEPLLVAALQRGLKSERVELMVTRHANAARDEMLELADEFRTLAQGSGVATPAIDTLYAAIDPAKPPMPEGSAFLSLDWRSLIPVAVALAAGTTAATFLVARCCRSKCCHK